MTREIKNPGRGYSGHEKQKLYHYDSNGKFLQIFESQAELRKEYFAKDVGKRPLMRSKRWNNFKYDILSDGTFYSNYRIGRDKLIKFEKVVNSPYCFNKATNNRKVGLYNLLHNKIAEFENGYIASLITKIPSSDIYHDCIKGKNITQGDIYFKYES